METGEARTTGKGEVEAEGCDRGRKLRPSGWHMTEIEEAHGRGGRWKWTRRQGRVINTL